MHSTSRVGRSWERSTAGLYNLRLYENKLHEITRIKSNYSIADYFCHLSSGDEMLLPNTRMYLHPEEHEKYRKKKSSYGINVGHEQRRECDIRIYVIL